MTAPNPFRYSRADVDPDDYEACEGCGVKEHPDDLNGVETWGERRLCDDCFCNRPASKGRDPDDRGYDR